MAKEFVNRMATMERVAAEIYSRESGQQLARLDNDTLTIGAFALTPTGLQVGQGATLEDWERVGGLLQALNGSLQWLIGDWLVMGERVWGKTYEDVAAATGYDYGTLRTYAYVARNVELSIRIDNLSFAHHQLVASLEPDAQKYWIHLAVQNRWPVAKMRLAIAQDNPNPTPPLSKTARLPVKLKAVKRYFEWFMNTESDVERFDEQTRRDDLQRIAETRAYLDERERRLRG